MHDMTKMGGWAAIGAGLTYVVGFALLTTVLAPLGYGTDEKNYPAMIAFAVDNHALMVAWNMIIYAVNAILLVILAAALWQKLKPAAPGLAQLSLTFGALWATLVLAAGMVANVGLAEAVETYATDPERAAQLFQIFSTVELGLGGGNEIAGGVWALVLAFAGLVTGLLPRGVSILGLVIGASGLGSIVPLVSEPLGALFGLGYIVWYFWIGVSLLRTRPAR